MFFRSADFRSPFFVLCVFAAGAPLTFPRSSQAAAKFVVRSEADAPDANPGDGVCASAAKECTLRAAIDEANAKNIAAQIELGASRYEIATPLRASAPVMLHGNSPNETLIAASSSFEGERLLIFDSSGAPDWREINDLTVDGNGRAGAIGTLREAPLRIQRTVVRGGNSRDGGGAISAFGPLVVLQSSLVENRVMQGGRGAALLVENAPAWITQTTITGNTGHNSGGVFARNAQVTIDFSTLVGNVGRPVGGYQQNPGSTLFIRGSWLGESSVATGARRIDCRSSAREENQVVSGDDNLLAVTGPTSQQLVEGVWEDSFEFFCKLSGANDRTGSLSAPLEGAWRVVTGPTGLVGVEADSRHPVSRMVRPDRCPAEDAWGRAIPQGQKCDAGALYATAWTGPAEQLTRDAAPTQPPADRAEKPVAEGTPPPRWAWAVVFGTAAVIAAFLLRRRGLKK